MWNLRVASRRDAGCLAVPCRSGIWWPGVEHGFAHPPRVDVAGTPGRRSFVQRAATRQQVVSLCEWSTNCFVDAESVEVMHVPFSPEHSGR